MPSESPTGIKFLLARNLPQLTLGHLSLRCPARKTKVQTNQWRYYQ